jgi:hypothetical protein
MHKVNLFLKFEGLIFLLVAVWIYASFSISWWYFFALILVPDVVMLGYLKNMRFGALLYNLGHTYTLPVLLFPVGLLLNNGMIIYAAVIWFAHISMDRMMGYGLKLDSHFKDTHLGRIGK